MPNILGLKLVPILVATLLFWMLGFLWYGVLFMDAWMAEHGMAAGEGGSFDIYMAGGILTTFMQVIGIGLILKWRGVSGIADGVKTVLLMWLLLALPFTMYAYLYQAEHSSTLLMIDGSHLFVGWLVTGIIHSVMK